MHVTNIEAKIRKMMGKDITIDDLPTEIIQDYLFKYLHDTDIYNLAQAGSHRLKEVSESFIQLVGTFLMVSGGVADNTNSNANNNLSKPNEYNAEEQLLVFKRIRQNKFSVVSKLSKLCPLSYEPLVFGGVLGGRILVGCKTDNKMYQYKPDDD